MDLTRARAEIAHARTLLLDAHPLLNEHKLYIQALIRMHSAYELMDLAHPRMDEILRAYSVRAVEFTRAEVLCFADDSMQLTTIDGTQARAFLTELEETYDTLWKKASKKRSQSSNDPTTSTT